MDGAGRGRAGQGREVEKRRSVWLKVMSWHSTSVAHCHCHCHCQQCHLCKMNATLKTTISFLHLCNFISINYFYSFFLFYLHYTKYHFLTIIFLIFYIFILLLYFEIRFHFTLAEPWILKIKIRYAHTHTHQTYFSLFCRSSLP